MCGSRNKHGDTDAQLLKYSVGAFHNMKLKAFKSDLLFITQWPATVPKGLSYYFCMMIEGSGSIPLTSESGSGSKFFWGLPDPDPLVRGMDPDPDPDPSIIMQK